jgi:hypothetical protein
MREKLPKEVAEDLTNLIRSLSLWNTVAQDNDETVEKRRRAMKWHNVAADQLLDYGIESSKYTGVDDE